MMLSSILDIGSFFIGMIINLLLVTLMCYYFKKKYESLEEAQNEQAKVLYELLRDRNHSKPATETKSCEVTIDIPVSEDGSDDESMDSVEEFEVHGVSEIKVVELETTMDPPDSLTIEKTEVVETTDPETEPELIMETNSAEDGFSKMSMKQLRDLLTEKGFKIKPSMKKNELVELAKIH